MPVDLVQVDPRILVLDRTGSQFPFSRGVMATSLLATGVPTEEAYRLASLVQARLLHHGRTEIHADEVIGVAHTTLVEHAISPEVADRWMAWRDARRSGRPIVIVVGGAPGVGKSTIATRLAVRLGITRVVPTDAIRETLRLVVPSIALPELHASTAELFDHPVLAGDITDSGFERFERLCDGVGDATAAVASRLANDKRSVILEGVHLRPGEMTSQLARHPARPIVVERLVVVDRSRHHGQNLAQRGGPEASDAGRHLDRFEVIRAIQAHLTRSARAAGIATVDARTATDLTQKLVDEVTAQLSAPISDAVVTPTAS